MKYHRWKPAAYVAGHGPRDQCVRCGLMREQRRKWRAPMYYRPEAPANLSPSASDFPCDKSPFGQVAAARTCEHHACRCARAAELAAMGQTEEAIAVHHQRVRCRQMGERHD